MDTAGVLEGGRSRRAWGLLTAALGLVGLFVLYAFAGTSVFELFLCFGADASGRTRIWRGDGGPGRSGDRGRVGDGRGFDRRGRVTNAGRPGDRRPRSTRHRTTPRRRNG